MAKRNFAVKLVKYLYKGDPIPLLPYGFYRARRDVEPGWEESVVMALRLARDAEIAADLLQRHGGLEPCLRLRQPAHKAPPVLARLMRVIRRAFP